MAKIGKKTIKKIRELLPVLVFMIHAWGGAEGWEVVRVFKETALGDPIHRAAYTQLSTPYPSIR